MQPPPPPAECRSESHPASAGARTGRETWAGGRRSFAAYRTALSLDPENRYAKQGLAQLAGAHDQFESP